MSSSLNIIVSDKVKARLSKETNTRLKIIVNEMNELGEVLPGKNYKVSMSDAYRIANQRAIGGTGRNALETIQLAWSLWNPPAPTWIREHPEFKPKLYENYILPGASTLSSYLNRLAKANEYLNSSDYYRSYQAVFYSAMEGYVQI